ncbi:MAG: putative membrane protein [Planctomycetota bacterium]|jgi:putative membrane protein
MVITMDTSMYSIIGLIEEGSWAIGSDGLLHTFAAGLPWLAFAFFLYLIVRAGMRLDRYRALSVLNEARQEDIHKAVIAAERRTVGEIIPVVLERSDEHPQANWLASLITVLLGSVLLVPWLPWGSPFALIASQLALGALGFLLTCVLPGFKRCFVSDERAAAVAGEQAIQEFYGLGLHRTEAQTGVLLFVSLFEHRVIVLGDEGIDAKVTPELWKTVEEAILRGVKEGDLSHGLVEGIGLCADVLEEHFPWTEGDRNELPDRVIVRAE